MDLMSVCFEFDKLIIGLIMFFVMFFVIFIGFLIFFMLIFLVFVFGIWGVNFKFIILLMMLNINFIMLND